MCSGRTRCPERGGRWRWRGSSRLLVVDRRHHTVTAQRPGRVVQKVGLHVRMPDAARLEPGGVGERKVLESDVPDGTPDAASDLDQRLQGRDDDLDLRQVLAVPGLVEDRLRRPVKIPLARFVQQLEGVLDIVGQGHPHALLGPRHREGRLLHLDDSERLVLQSGRMEAILQRLWDQTTR